MDWPRATFLLTMSLHAPEDQAARVNCSLAILFFAPFSESEQLGSHDRTTTLTSKPVSPVIDVCPNDCSDDEDRRVAGIAPSHSCRFGLAAGGLCPPDRQHGGHKDTDVAGHE